MLPNQVYKCQTEQKQAHGKHCVAHELLAGEAAMAKNKQGRSFVPGVVKKKLGPLTYLIQMQDGLHGLEETH